MSEVPRVYYQKASQASPNHLFDVVQAAIFWNQEGRCFYQSADKSYENNCFFNKRIYSECFIAGQELMRQLLKNQRTFVLSELMIYFHDIYNEHLNIPNNKQHTNTSPP